MFLRTDHVQRVLDEIRLFPVVCITGPRQVGKTTLAEEVSNAFDGPATHLDLEHPLHLQRLLDDPVLALKDLQGLVVIDEIQRRPNLFPYLRVLADRQPQPASFLLLGSAVRSRLNQSTESLAGRIIHYELSGLSLNEVGSSSHEKLWLHGGLPVPFLANSSDAFTWLDAHMRTVVERDLTELGWRLPSVPLMRFLLMLAHWHGQVWNASEFARSLGVSPTTVRRYLDALSSAMVVRQLQPWLPDTRKRLVKAPKIYVRDSGFLHSLLGTHSLDSLNVHPKVGASWEGFVLDQVAQLLHLRSEEMYYWRTVAGAELDLVVLGNDGKPQTGVEVKFTSSPRMTTSIRNAIQDLSLSEVIVVHAGKESFRLSDQVRALAFSDLSRTALTG